MMNILEKAILFATEAHEGQRDKNGEPYILHPLRVMFKVRAQGECEVVQIAAVLHDVVEDTGATLDDIEDEFGAFVRMTVGTLTEREGEKYTDYIERVAERPSATKIKLADLEDNMDPKRVTTEFGLYKRYFKAYRRLTHGRE
jgi:(p)ppGpp synthase/HD superfamily hydrolase